MARTRYLKHDFFLDEHLAQQTAMGRLLFAGLWVIADREGRLEDSPAKIKVQILPYDNVDIENLLKELSFGFITRYSVGGKRYIQIKNFAKHQKPHPKEAKSEHPAPPAAKKATKRKAGNVHPCMNNLANLGFQRNAPSAFNTNGDVNGDIDGERTIEPSAQNLEPIKKERTPIQRVVEAYKEAKGVPMDDKGWDRNNFGRYSKAAKGLLECFKGDTKSAAAYIFGRAFDLDDKKLTWTLETIARNAWDGEGLTKEKEDGSENGKMGAIVVPGQGGHRRLASAGSLVGDTIRAIENAAVLAEGTRDLGSDDEDFPDDGSHEP